MLSAQQALDSMLLAATPLTQWGWLDTLEANGRFLAQDLTSELDVPPMDNTQMDGYAVRIDDCQADFTRLPVSQRIPAGHVPQPLEAGTAARIFTGAMIPAGADAVVMQEACTASVVDGRDVVDIRHRPVHGEWVRRAGEDVQRGAVILRAGTRLGAAELGLAASVGIARVPVHRRLRVAVFFTGDELSMPGEALRAGAIYNSNRFTLRALLENLGCEVIDFGIVPDRLDQTRKTLRDAASESDLIITSGGVSVGEEDHVKPAVEAEGTLAMWQIAIKPGKPLAFGHVRKGDAPTAGSAHFVGLPGNPVSSLVTFMLFVRPFILRLNGVTDVAPKSYTLRADFDWPREDSRNEFLRARLNHTGGLEIFPNQSSAVLTSAVWGDGLIDNPPKTRIVRGDWVKFIPFESIQ